MWRRATGNVSMGLGALWAATAAAKMLFGIRVTLPLIPPVDLTRVDTTHALLMAAVFVSLGAVLVRWANAHERVLAQKKPDMLGEGAAELPYVDIGRRERVTPLP